jgi:hypothetical protein
MTAAARHARSGAVTVAVRQAMTSAGPCEPGDVLGAIEGDFVLVGHDLSRWLEEVLERLLGGGGELVTVVGGRRRSDLAERVRGVRGAAPIPLSTSSSTTAGSRATRCSSASSRSGRIPTCPPSPGSPSSRPWPASRLPKIEKAFGYRTVGDLLQHYPRKYVEKGSLSDLGTIAPDEHVTVIARVVHAEPRTYRIVGVAASPTGSRRSLPPRTTSCP